MSCAGLLALQQAGAPTWSPGAGPARRSVPHRSARWTGAGRVGSRALRTSGRECVAQGRGLRGNRASRKGQRGTRTARGATDFLQSASLPASAGPAVLVQPESVRAELRLAVWRALYGSRGPRCSGFWAGRLRRKGSRDELACPTRGQTNIGGQRMTGPQRRPASLRVFPELGPVMRWPGNRLSRRFSRSGGQRSRREAARSALGGSAAGPGCFGGAMGVRRSAWPTGA